MSGFTFEPCFLVHNSSLYLAPLKSMSYGVQVSTVDPD